MLCIIKSIWKEFVTNEDLLKLKTRVTMALGPDGWLFGTHTPNCQILENHVLKFSQNFLRESLQVAETTD